MKSTGIIRRIDDLGRVVIPKEIRRALEIKEGAPSGNLYRTRWLYHLQTLSQVLGRMCY